MQAYTELTKNAQQYKNRTCYVAFTAHNNMFKQTVVLTVTYFVAIYIMSTYTYLSVCLPICPLTSIHPSVFLSVRLSPCLSVRPLSVLSILLSVCPTIRTSKSLSVSLSVNFFCISLCLCLCLAIHC
jgi:hypothetical protein